MCCVAGSHVTTPFKTRSLPNMHSGTQGQRSARCQQPRLATWQTPLPMQPRDMSRLSANFFQHRST